MERLNFELSFDADLNVKRPIAASACWSAEGLSANTAASEAY